MSVRNLLLRAYPRTWREEYGDELAGILARKRLTPGMAADILGGAARQHFYRDEPWRICGAGLLVWELVVAGLVVTYPSFLRGYLAGFLFVFGAGAWTVLGRKSGTRRAIVAAAKAAVVGHSPDLLLYLVMFRRGGSRWVGETFVVTAVLSLLCGVAGAAVGRGVAWIRKGPLVTP